MAAEERIEKISRIEGTEGTGGAIDIEPADRVAPNKEHFNSLLGSADGVTPATSVEIAPTKVQEVSFNPSAVNRKTAPEVAQQVQDALNKIDEIKGKLETPGLELGTDAQMKMRNSLWNIDARLQKSSGIEGRTEHSPVQAIGSAEAPPSSSPIHRFLGMLAGSEDQLKSVFANVSNIGGATGQVNPAEMLALQMKMNAVSERLDFFTAVLNKALESTKALMNVQV